MNGSVVRDRRTLLVTTMTLQSPLRLLTIAAADVLVAPILATSVASVPNARNVERARTNTAPGATAAIPHLREATPQRCQTTILLPHAATMPAATSVQNVARDTDAKTEQTIVAAARVTTVAIAQVNLTMVGTEEAVKTSSQKWLAFSIPTARMEIVRCPW